MGVSPEELATTYPLLYHMADSRSWESIRTHGLLSTSALLDLFRLSGKERESIESQRRPECVEITYKALLFGLLVFGFHIVEERVKRLLRGEDMAGALHNMHITDLIGRTLVMFCTFLPFFAFREVRRVLAEDKFQELFFYSGAIAKSDFSGGRANE